MFSDLIIKGSRVLETRKGSSSLNGEFSAYFKTADGKYYFCNCEQYNSSIRFHTTARVSALEFEKAYLKSKQVQNPLASANRDDEGSVKAGEPDVRVNFYEDCRFFGSGQVHKVTSKELHELSQDISDWRVKTTVSKQAIKKTYQWMQQRFAEALTPEEIISFTVDLLNIRSEQFEESLATTTPEAPPTDIPEKRVPTLVTISHAYDTYGIMLEKADKTELRSKVGGHPLLPKKHEMLKLENEYHFVAQIDTTELPESANTMPEGVFSFFISKNFDASQYYAALEAKIFFFSKEIELNEAGYLNPLDERSFLFKALDQSHFKDTIENLDYILSPQFLPGLHGDDYAQSLVEKSFNHGTSTVHESENSAFTMSPLLRIKSSSLKLEGESIFQGLNTVFFMEKSNFLRQDFSKCYYAVEHF